MLRDPLCIIKAVPETKVLAQGVQASNRHTRHDRGSKINTLVGHLSSLLLFPSFQNKHFLILKISPETKRTLLN